MSFEILFSVFTELLTARRVTAQTLAKKYGISNRTVYRYVKRLSAVLPLHVQRGRKGGVYLSDDYRLPVDFLTEEEHDALLDALVLAYATYADEKFLSINRKLTAQKQAEKTLSSARASGEEILFFPTEEEQAIASRFQLLQACIQEKTLSRVLTQAEEILFEPISLVLYGGKWRLFCFQISTRSFRLFPLEEMRGVLQTQTRFYPREYPPELLSALLCKC